MLPSARQKSRSVIKSASTSGLSLVIPTSDFSCTYPSYVAYRVLYIHVRVYLYKWSMWQSGLKFLIFHFSLWTHRVRFSFFSRWCTVKRSTDRVARWIVDRIFAGYVALPWAESARYQSETAHYHSSGTVRLWFYRKHHQGLLRRQRFLYDASSSNGKSDFTFSLISYIYKAYGALSSCRLSTVASRARCVH
jgi:hypothetical protein